MLGRSKPYLLIVLGMLLAAFLLNPPVAFATKLPTACNIFHEKQINKSGPCGHQALLSKDKSLEMAVFSVFRANMEISELPTAFHNHPISFTFSSIFADPLPLRC